MIKFKLNIFRFDAKMDYLPYFKKYDISIDESESLCELLKKVKSEDVYFDFDPKEFVKLDGYALKTDVLLKDIYEKFGSEITIEPLSKKRSTKDLIIDKKDFYDAFSKAESIIGSEYKKRYEELIGYFYSSEMLNYNKNYLGDALFITVYEAIKDKPQVREEALKLIADDEIGIWLHTAQSYTIYEPKIDIEEIIVELKKQIFELDLLSLKVEAV